MTTPAPTLVRLLVCGNVDRCDDGAAIWAAHELLADATAEYGLELDVHQCGQLDVVQVLDLGSGVPLVIIDCATGVDAGEVVTLPLDDLLAHPRGPSPHSSHALPIDQVLGVARQLSEAPIDGLFVGVGGADFGFGRTFSTPVRKALPAFIAAITAAIERLAGQPVPVGA
ncbi:MAG TPA: hydrogenase maturation protease [Candidatus Limnocylindrales bacterium]|nr:hydrogenase maturation protease [Candidatus Limnocylindrales bacterium]